MIIIIRFGENNVLGTIYTNFRGGRGVGEWDMVHLTFYLFVIYKNGIITRA